MDFIWNWELSLFLFLIPNSLILTVVSKQQNPIWMQHSELDRTQKRLTTNQFGQIYCWIWYDTGHTDITLHIWVIFLRTGKMSKNRHIFYFWSLTVTKQSDFFQVFSTVLKRFGPVQSENTFILVLAIFFVEKFTFFAQNQIFR